MKKISSSNKQCRLTKLGSEKLEKALEKHFGENPANYKVSKEFDLDRETVTKIRSYNINPYKPVAAKSIRELFEKLELELEDDDYEQVQTTSKEARSRSPVPNPFGDEGPIADRKRFFGQQKLLEDLFAAVNSGYNRSLVGKPGVGKSSILKMVCQLGIERYNDRDPKKFVYLDMRLVLNGQSFFEDLRDKLEMSSADPSKIYREAEKRRVKYVLCLDEIDQLCNTTQFPVEHRDILAGWSDGIDRPFTLVIASQRPLEELFPDSPNRSSPLAGICLPKEVNPFNREETEEFIRQKLEGTEVEFEADEVRELYEKSGGLPRKLQQLAAALYQEKLEKLM